MNSMKKNAKGQFEAAADFLDVFRGYPYSSAGVAAEISGVASTRGITLRDAAHQSGVQESYFESLWNGAVSLEETPISVLERFSAFFELPPFVLLIAAGYLRKGDFDFVPSAGAIEPYAGEWKDWLLSEWVADLQALVEEFGLEPDRRATRNLKETEQAYDVCRSVVFPMPSSPNMNNFTGNYLQDWILLTCRTRKISPTVMGKEVGIQPLYLGRFLQGRIDLGNFSREQLKRIAKFLGVPMVCVLAATDFLGGLEDSERKLSK